MRAQTAVALADVGRIEARLGGEGYQHRLVVAEEFDYSEHEIGLAAGGANLRRADAGGGEEVAEPLAIRGNEGKRLNCQRFRRFSRHA